MPAERFYIDAELEGTLSLEGAELHHLAHVMRIQPGEVIELVNGRGELASAKVLSVGKREAILAVISGKKIEVPPPNCILAIPLMRPSKLEFVIEKCTELGADAFWLYPAEYSDKEGLSPNQLERLHHIAISAMKQCGRLDLPEIRVARRFDDLFNDSYTYLFGDTRPGAKAIEREEKVVFITGPEKGFSARELKLLDGKGKGVRLHKNILRAETAPLVVILCEMGANHNGAKSQ